MPIPDDIRPLLDEVNAEPRDLYGARLDRLVLYGSYARGDVHDESDVDLLVVLEGPVDPGREVRRMSDVRSRLGLAHEVALSLLPVSSKDAEAAAEDATSAASPWLINVSREGIQL